MKILNWSLIVFSALAIFGVMNEPNPTNSSIWAVIYAGAVIAQTITIIKK